MSVLVDYQIRSACKEYNLIDPMSERGGKISYGLSSCGYDIRLANTLKVYKIFPSHLDPLSVTEADVETINIPDGKSYPLPSGGFVLGASLEYIRMPSHLVAFVTDKSTYSRCGLAVQNTVLEPGWEGIITLEISNHGPRTLLLRAGEGIAQLIFYELGDNVEVSYGDRSGRYQKQTGVTLPRGEPTGLVGDPS